MGALLVALIPFPCAGGTAGNAFHSLDGAAPQLVPRELPKQKQAWYTSPAVLIGNRGMKWGQTTIPQRLVLAQCPHSADTLWILGCVQCVLPR